MKMTASSTVAIACSVGCSPPKSRRYAGSASNAIPIITPCRRCCQARARGVSSSSTPAKPIHTSPLSQLPPPANPKAAQAVREALSLIGVPYVWGGTSRAGFDCSGFTQHVWAAAGIKIPRTVRAQAEAGTRVPLSKAEPGDLVVFYASQHHVGIYIGNGLFDT